MSVSLLDVSRAAQVRALALTAETAGYLVLAVIDAGGLRQCTALSEMMLLDSGEVRLGAALRSDHPAAPEQALRSLLGQLLAFCSAAHPTLNEVSRAERQGTLARELEAALIPVNRAAGRRTLARACRETERAKGAGKLNDVPSEVQPLAPAAAAPVQVAPVAEPAASPSVVSAAKVERRRQPRSVTATTNQASSSGAPRIVEAPAADAPQFTNVEHTVRIDLLRSTVAPVADSAAPQPQANAQHSQQGNTPFLGSVITELRDQPLEHDTQLDADVAPVEPIASPEPARAAEPELEPEPVLASPLSQTPPWQPNVAPLLRPMPGVQAAAPELLSAAPVEAEAVSPQLIASPLDESPLAEAEGFFLLLDEAGSNQPPTVAAAPQQETVEIAQLQSEPDPEQDEGQIVEEQFENDLEDDSQQPLVQMSSNEPSSKAPLYQPRKTDLADLFAELDQPSVEQDVAYELKLMAGVEASASSQTPPPVGFSDLSEPSPLPPEATDDKGPASQVLARAKGVGLATLMGLGVALLLLRAPQGAPATRSLASGVQQRCTASVQVVDAPNDAEIRVRAPAPNARFAPLAAHGATALFPQLPCGTSLEVMIRDSANVDASWVVIPIASEELTALTEQAPLRVSAQPEQRIVE